MSPKDISFKQVITALLDDQKPFPPAYLQRFSDLTALELQELKTAWPNVNPERKTNLLTDLEDLADVETLVNFSDLARQLVSDPLPSVRATAIRLLWEELDNKLIPTFLSIMEKDPDDVVRATAATALGQFIYLGELDEVPPAAHSRIEDALLKKVNGPDAPLVRRRALEALGYSSRHEVPPLIRKYYHSTETEWVVSALYAMGRSLDPQWEQDVLTSIASPDPEIKFEAVRAAGPLEFSSARSLLLDMLDHAETLDDELRSAVIWSLSQIGGEGVAEVFEKLYEETEDDEEIEFLELAVENLEFKENGDEFDFFSVEPEGSEDFTSIIDLEEDAPKEDKDVTPKKTTRKKPKK